MERRNFLLGVSGSAIGGSALIGSGAFSRIESDRSLSIEVAEDPDGYLGLSACDSPNGEQYAELDSNGHLRVDIGESDAGGEGVNSNSQTWVDDVVQLCNQGTDDACVWIGDENWPTVEDGEYEGDPRVEIYVADEGRSTILGEENALAIEVGECACLGIAVRTQGLSDDDTLLEALDNRITVHADVDGACLDAVPKPDCVECGEGGDAERLSWLEIENTGDEKEIEVRHGPGTDDEEPVFGPETVGSGETFDFEIPTEGPSGISFYVDGQPIALDHAADNPASESAQG